MKWNSWSAITATTGLIILLKINIHIRDDSNMGRHSYWSMNSIWGFKSLSRFAMKTFTLIPLLQNCSWVAFIDLQHSLFQLCGLFMSKAELGKQGRYPQEWPLLELQGLNKSPLVYMWLTLMYLTTALIYWHRNVEPNWRTNYNFGTFKQQIRSLNRTKCTVPSSEWQRTLAGEVAWIYCPMLITGFLKCHNYN